MTCLVLCGRQTERESTAYWHIGDTQILHVLLKMAERQMRLHFLVCVFLFSLSLQRAAGTDRPAFWVSTADGLVHQTPADVQ